MKKNIFILTMLILATGLAKAQTLRASDFRDKQGKDSTFVEVFADGNLRGLMANTSDGSAAATGALGISVRRPNIIWNGFINIASTIDTLSEDFGSIILNPATGRNLSSGLVEAFVKTKHKIGQHYYMSASSSYWKSDSVTKSATIIGMGALGTLEILNGLSGQNDLYFGVEFGLSYRGISGNVTNNEEYYKKTLGTSGRHFAGLEGGLVIKFNQVTAGLNLYWLHDLKGKAKIDGISSVQLTAGIKISGAFFKGVVVKKK
jgi:hypothetical protein